MSRDETDEAGLMPAPSDSSLPVRAELAGVVDRLAEAARRYLEGVDERPVLGPRVEEALRALSAALPETGVGAERALDELRRHGIEASAATSGPRCFHFVVGGVTPAALGADWLASLLDQIAYTWITSPLGVELELESLDWLKDLFDLPDELIGVMTTGATMSNFVGLAAARGWWAEEHGVDVSEEGLAGLPPTPVLSSGFIHASSLKVLSLLGIGRASVVRCARDAAGRLDIDALERELAALDGRPSILIANAGEVNAGEFDPIDRMADLAEEHGAWLHVDGAFGLFARVSPETAHLAAGAERADSITVDGHKWLNVPYDCGFAFIRDPELLAKAFRYTAAYLPDPTDPRPTLGALGPESSRRARSLPVWATLRAYGRSGYRQMVERHLALARRLARKVDEAPDLERLAEVPLNIVCFRYAPAGVGEDELDALNERLGQALLDDGRVFAGTTDFEGKVALRPAIVNWRTREQDVDLFVEVVRELGAELRGEV